MFRTRATERTRQVYDSASEATMLIFLSWSGDTSKAVAKALRECLPLICDSFKPWMSERDIALGAPWFPEVLLTLGNCGAGILCLTPHNQNQPWLVFEAGAVVKSVPERRLAIPYLYGMGAGDLGPPLREIQAATNALDEGANWKMIQDLYDALPAPEKLIDKDVLRNRFKMTWRELRPRLDEVAAVAAPSPAPPEKIDEVLALVRELVERDRDRVASEADPKLVALMRGLQGQTIRDLLTRQYVRGVGGLRASAVVEPPSADAAATVPPPKS